MYWMTAGKIAGLKDQQLCNNNYLKYSLEKMYVYACRSTYISFETKGRLI